MRIFSKTLNSVLTSGGKGVCGRNGGGVGDVLLRRVRELVMNDEEEFYSDGVKVKSGKFTGRRGAEIREVFGREHDSFLVFFQMPKNRSDLTQ